MGAMGALAPAILGQSITVSTRNSKVLNTPLHKIRQKPEVLRAFEVKIVGNTV